MVGSPFSDPPLGTVVFMQSPCHKPPETKKHPCHLRLVDFAVAVALERRGCGTSIVKVEGRETVGGVGVLSGTAKRGRRTRQGQHLGYGTWHTNSTLTVTQHAQTNVYTTRFVRSLCLQSLGDNFASREVKPCIYIYIYIHYIYIYIHRERTGEKYMCIHICIHICIYIYIYTHYHAGAR